MNPISRNIDTSVEYDVVVCGGGPAGFIAAIASARNGARTLLIEKHAFLGGMATAALVGPISKFNSQGRRVVRGIPEEFIQELSKLGGARIDLPSGNVPFDPELYKLVAMRMVREAGVELMLHSKVIGVETDDGSSPAYSTVFIATDGERRAVDTKIVIDASGTGAVAAMAGAPWHYRCGEDGEMQPMSLQFILGGVDTDALTLLMAEDGVKYRNFELADLLNDEVKAGRLRNFGGPWTVHGSTLHAGQVSVNVTRYAGNAAVVEDITQAEIAMREEVFHIVDVFKSKHAAFRNCHLLYTAPQTGIRETRSIEGLYTLTVDDILSPPGHPDIIALGAHPIDVHRAGTSNTDATFLQKPYGIPYRCLVPKDCSNLIVAGGSVSAMREAFASARVQAQCMAMGQAAGTAAALCVKGGLSPDALDGTELREILRVQGAEVDENFMNTKIEVNKDTESGFELIAAPFTPFDASGELNVGAISDVARHYVEQQVTGAFICGTTGEGYSLSLDERKAVAETWVKEAAPLGLKVFVHVGYTAVESSCLLGKHAEEIGADAIASIGPCAFPATSPVSFVAMLAQIASASSLPFYYYHMPSVAKVPYKASELLPLMLKSIPTFAGVKFTYEDIDDFRTCVEQCPTGIKMYFGRDEILLKGLEAGAHGAVGSTYNFRTDVYYDVIRAYQSQDLEQAQAHQAKATGYISMFQKYGGLNAAKDLMKMCGYDCGAPRLPLEKLTPEKYEAMQRDLESAGFFQHAADCV